MADLIDSKDAQRLLGCDEATLKGHVDRGIIHGEMSGGKLRVSKEDVVKLHDAQGEHLKLDDEEDGTIVLTGDSDNLTIDLGSVDNAETLSFKPDEKASGTGKHDTQTLSFGDELEVLSFEDPKPTEKATKPSATDTKFTDQFTDSKTEVMIAVDDAIGTGPVSYNTGLDAMATMAAGSSNESSRRSVRSNRVRVESAPVSPLWLGVMSLNAAVLLLLVAPYAVLSVWPNEGRDAAGNILRGVDDGFWSGIASTAAGFSVEPSKERFMATHGDKEWTDIKTVDSQAEWRITKYRGDFKKEGERLKTFIIEKVSEDGKKASATGREYSIIEVKGGQAGAEITEEKVDLGSK